MTYSRLLIALVSVLTVIGFSWSKPAEAALPPGNAVKDPYAILRTALPIEQKELRELQRKLEDTSDLIRGNRWTSVEQNASSSLFLINTKKNNIINSMPNSQKSEAENLITPLSNSIENLIDLANKKDKSGFISERGKSLKVVGDLESLLIAENFPFSIPKEFDNLPRLLGRANVSIETTKGKMHAIIDGYNAPLTSGAFIDLCLKGFYNDLPFTRAEDFYVLQTGNPKGPEVGYIDQDTNKERHVPLEIRIPGKEETFYNQTFEDLGLYTDTPILPFTTLGTMGWAHSSQALDDGSSQFFFFLYEAELNPAGRNLIDGRNAAFGYVVEGNEILTKLGVDDRIISIKVLDGSDRFQPHA